MHATKSGQGGECYKPTWRHFNEMHFVANQEIEHTNISESNISYDELVINNYVGFAFCIFSFIIYFVSFSRRCTM